MKFNVFYGTEDFEKLFDNLIEDKIKSITENIKNAHNNKSYKYCSFTQEKVDINE